MKEKIGRYHRPDQNLQISFIRLWIHPNFVFNDESQPPNYSEITLQKVFFTFNWNLYLAQQWVMRCITESQPLILNPKKCMVSVRLKVPPIIDQIGLWLLLQNSTIFDLVCFCKILNWIWLDLVGVMCLKATTWDFKSSITSPNVSTLINPFYAVASVVKFWRKTDN